MKFERWMRVAAIVGTLLAFLQSGRAAAQSSEILKLIREGHRQSREAIRTIHAVFETRQQAFLDDEKTPAGKPMVRKVEWWQDGTNRRWNVEANAQVRGTPKPSSPGKPGPVVAWSLKQASAVQDGEFTSISSDGVETSKPGAYDAEIKAFSSHDAHGDDLWFRALFVVVTRPHYPFVDLIANDELVKKLDAVELAGRRYYRIVVPSPLKKGSEYEMLIDPNRNFLVKKFVMKPSPTAVARWETEVLSYRSIGQAGFFPNQTLTRQYFIRKDRTERLSSVTETKFVSITINQPISPELFRIAIPAGANVTDGRTGTTYIMGKDGKPKGRVAPLPEGNVVTGFASEAQMAGSGVPWVILVLIGGALAFLIVRFVYWRKVKTS